MDKPRIVIRTPERPMGPILVQGEVELVDQDGNAVPIPPSKTPGTFKLCSCGRSGTRPFCDGTHKQLAASR